MSNNGEPRKLRTEKEICEYLEINPRTFRRLKVKSAGTRHAAPVVFESYRLHSWQVTWTDIIRAWYIAVKTPGTLDKEKSPR